MELLTDVDDRPTRTTRQFCSRLRFLPVLIGFFAHCRRRLGGLGLNF